MLCELVRRIESVRKDGSNVIARWLVILARRVIIDQRGRAVTTKRGGDHRRIVSVFLESDDVAPIVIGWTNLRRTGRVRISGGLIHTNP